MRLTGKGSAYRAVGLDEATHQTRFDEGAAVGNRVVGIEHLQRGHRVDLPDRQGDHVARVPLGGIDQESGRLSGILQGRHLAKSELLDLGEQTRLTDAAGDLVGADVRGPVSYTHLTLPTIL